MPIPIESQEEFPQGWLEHWEVVEVDIVLILLRVELPDNNLHMVTMVETDLRSKTTNINSRMTRPGN
jgi:hypothetical protein